MGEDMGDALKGHGGITEGRVVMVVVVICDGQLLLLSHSPGHRWGGAEEGGQTPGSHQSHSGHGVGGSGVSQG